MIGLDAAPELAPYQTQPAQMPAASVGKVGRLRLCFAQRGERTILAHIYRQAPLLVQRALYWDEEMPEMACVYVLTTSGGILQGDRLGIDIELAAGARAHVTTQAATKIQQMDANYGVQTQRVTLAADSYLEYLPEPTIPYRDSRFLTHTELRVEPSATLLYGETLMPGRKYHAGGEIFAYEVFSSMLRAARPQGPELFVEKFLIEPGRHDVARLGVMGGFHVFANVVLMTPPEVAARVFDRTTPTWDDGTPLIAAASRLPNDAGLIYKVLGTESEPVRDAVRAFCAIAREEAVGRAVPRPFAWR